MPVPVAAAAGLAGGPVGLALSLGGSLVSSILGGNAEKKRIKYVNSELAKLAGISRQEFDRRYAFQNEGDKTQYALEDQSAAEQDRLSRDGFGQIMDVRRTNFDTNAGLEDDRLTTSRNADTKLFDTLRDVREGNLALSEAELARQREFQGQADSLAADFVAASGQPAFDASRGASELRRAATTNAAITGPSVSAPLTEGGHSLIRRVYEQKATEGVDAARTEAAGRSKVAAYGDALVDAQRGLAKFAESTDIVGRKADLSGAALTPELAAGGVKAGNAVDEASATKTIAGDYASGKTSVNNDYASDLSNTLRNYFSDTMDSSAGYFDRKGEGEASYTDDKVRASETYEQALRDTTNMRISGAKASNPVGSVVSSLASLASTRAAYGGTGSKTKSSAISRFFG